MQSLSALSDPVRRAGLQIFAGCLAQDGKAHKIRQIIGAMGRDGTGRISFLPEIDKGQGGVAGGFEDLYLSFQIKNLATAHGAG